MILLTCDHPKRELNFLKNLKKKLETRSLKVKIINKGLLVKAYNLYKPSIITIPHTVSNFFHPINQLKNKTTIVVVPSESPIFVDRFIEMHCTGVFKNHVVKSNHNKVDYFFTHSNYIKKYLKKKRYVKTKMINTGFLYYDYWYKNLKKLSIKKNNPTKKIGIALTLVAPFPWYKKEDFIRQYSKINHELGYFNNPWRISEVSLIMYYYSLLFEIIKLFSKKYKFSIRPHPLDTKADWRSIFKNNNNVEIDRNSEISNWINEQDLIISTFSAINIDSYIFRKPHISLINMIPKNFVNYLRYKSYKISDYKEFFSEKPKNISELTKLIRSCKFKKNREMDKKLSKYYQFPQKKTASTLIADELSKIYKIKKFKFKRIYYSNIQKNISPIIGNNFFDFLTYNISEIKIYFSRFDENTYISLIKEIIFYIPKKIYKKFSH